MTKLQQKCNIEMAICNFIPFAFITENQTCQWDDVVKNVRLVLEIENSMFIQP